MAALFRLQDTYNISTPEMVTNDIPGEQGKPKKNDICQWSRAGEQFRYIKIQSIAIDEHK